MAKIHDVVNVTRLEPYRAPSFGDVEESPAPLEVEDHDEYEVERILDVCKSKGRIEYYIKWKGYDGTLESAIWEPVSHLTHAKRLIKQFRDMLKRSVNT